MNEIPSWKADTQETDLLLTDIEDRDPEAFRAGQALVEARQSRMNWLASLARRRLSRGLDQTRVAASMSTSQSTVARLEAGLSDPKLSTLQRYAHAIGYDLHISLTPQLERAKLIKEVDLPRAVAEAAKAMHELIVSYKLSPRKRVVHGKPIHFGLEGYESGTLNLEMLPGEVTISGQIADGAQLATLIDKVLEYSDEDRISIDVAVARGASAG
jgi:transcriptional regulator with XRE-family HTH domain